MGKKGGQRPGNSFPGLTPICPYCDKPSVMVTGRTIYPRNRGVWDDKNFYMCVGCGAWVGCHDGTDKPLGRLADKELRIAKQTMHALFDPLWEAKIRRDGCPKHVARGAAYKWLAEQLGIPAADCHIGMMDVPTINRAVRIIRALKRPKEGARAQA